MDVLEGQSVSFGVVVDTNGDLAYTAADVDTFADELSATAGSNTIRVFVDSDNDDLTGFYLKGIGADYMLHIYGSDGMIKKTGKFDDETTLALSKAIDGAVSRFMKEHPEAGLAEH